MHRVRLNYNPPTLHGWRGATLDPSPFTRNPQTHTPNPNPPNPNPKTPNSKRWALNSEPPKLVNKSQTQPPNFQTPNLKPQTLILWVECLSVPGLNPSPNVLPVSTLVSSRTRTPRWCVWSSALCLAHNILLSLHSLLHSLRHLSARGARA